MKKNSKRLLMFGMTSLMLMSGCKKSKVVEINGETYLQNGEQYVSISMGPKVFEPGTHYITFNNGLKSGKRGWNKINFPEVPEGYKYVESIPIAQGYGSTDSILHIFVNEVPVEVEPTYNSQTGEIEYNNIGKPVKKLILE